MPKMKPYNLMITNKKWHRKKERKNPTFTLACGVRRRIDAKRKSCILLLLFLLLFFSAEKKAHTRETRRRY